MFRLQEQPISTAELLEYVRQDDDGAVALFLGTVRDHNQGRRVTHLIYHAYPEMAQGELERLGRQTQQQFAIHRLAAVHRLGHLVVGDTAVAVAASAAHRDAAFEACRYMIDTLKKTVPIWKKEYFEGGEAWIEGAP